MQGPKTLYNLGQLPTFASISNGVNEIYYGMPELFSNGIMKLSQHVTKTENVSHNLETEKAKRTKKLLDFIHNNFAYPLDEIVNIETCFYSNTDSEDFIIDFVPSDPRILIGSICSGHGFKFAPLTGKIMAQLITQQKTSVPEFEKHRSFFAF